MPIFKLSEKKDKSAKVIAGIRLTESSYVNPNTARIDLKELRKDERLGLSANDLGREDDVTQDMSEPIETQEPPEEFEAEPETSNAEEEVITLPPVSKTPEPPAPTLKPPAQEAPDSTSMPEDEEPAGLEEPEERPVEEGKIKLPPPGKPLVAPIRQTSPAATLTLKAPTASDFDNQPETQVATPEGLKATMLKKTEEISADKKPAAEIKEPESAAKPIEGEGKIKLPPPGTPPLVTFKSSVKDTETIPLPKKDLSPAAEPAKTEKSIIAATEEKIEIKLPPMAKVPEVTPQAPTLKPPVAEEKPAVAIEEKKDSETPAQLTPDKEAEPKLDSIDENKAVEEPKEETSADESDTVEPEGEKSTAAPAPTGSMPPKKPPMGMSRPPLGKKPMMPLGSKFGKKPLSALGAKKPLGAFGKKPIGGSPKPPAGIKKPGPQEEKPAVKPPVDEKPSTAPELEQKTPITPLVAEKAPEKDIAAPETKPAAPIPTLKPPAAPAPMLKPPVPPAPPSLKPSVPAPELKPVAEAEKQEAKPETVPVVPVETKVPAAITESPKKQAEIKPPVPLPPLKPVASAPISTLKPPVSDEKSVAAPAEVKAPVAIEPAKEQAETKPAAPEAKPPTAAPALKLKPPVPSAPPPLLKPPAPVSLAKPDSEVEKQEKGPEDNIPSLRPQGATAPGLPIPPKPPIAQPAKEVKTEEAKKPEVPEIKTLKPLGTDAPTMILPAASKGLSSIPEKAEKAPGIAPEDDLQGPTAKIPAYERADQIEPPPRIPDEAKASASLYCFYKIAGTWKRKHYLSTDHGVRIGGSSSLHEITLNDDDLDKIQVVIIEIEDKWLVMDTGNKDMMRVDGSPARQIDLKPNLPFVLQIGSEPVIAFLSTIDNTPELIPAQKQPDAKPGAMLISKIKFGEKEFPIHIPEKIPEEQSKEVSISVKPEFRLIPTHDPNKVLQPLLIPTSGAPVHIGRSSKMSELIVNDKNVSRKHSKITVQGKTLIIEDCQTSNGTYVNSEEISEPTTVHAGDVITFGSIPFIVSLK